MGFNNFRLLPVSLGLFTTFALAAEVAPGPAFTATQAAQGADIYAEQCADCHGADLAGLALVPSLTGNYFSERWGNNALDSLADSVRRMPPGAENSLSETDYTDVLAFLLAENGLPAGPDALTLDVAALAGVTIPVIAAQNRSADSPLPLRFHTGGPVTASPLLDNLSPVSDAMLLSPPPGEWLNWRRTLDASGHSPLDQIDKSNVNDMQLAWSWSLPSGANMVAPLVHDGVFFAYSHGDVVQALDAATGDLLWGWQRQLDAGRNPDSKKGLAIYGDSLIVATSDLHLIALDTRSGTVLWDHKVAVDNPDAYWFKSAPIIANGKVIIGLTGRHAARGGNPVLAIDATSGEEVWRFNTIAQPGEPGGDSWNGLPMARRTGGSIWIPASFDPELNLVYLGPAPTYETELLRPVPGQPARDNDALYTNTTLALDADTGDLEWHFQHARNDQLDHDWAYERQIVELPVAGEMRKVVVTGGKLAIFEALDAATGEYYWSVDLDMQNVISEIDPGSGDKVYSPRAIPDYEARLTEFSLPGICPDWLGARNMQATAFNPANNLLFIPLSDTCLDDETGERWQKYPDPASNGTYGIITALNLATREVEWSVRQRGPQAAANLSTAGGLLFIGSVDRWVKALDQDNGATLWQRRLDNAVNSYPVTYLANGRQFVAVATNSGAIHTRTMRNNAGITIPETGATLWVFALPSP